MHLASLSALIYKQRMIQELVLLVHSFRFHRWGFFESLRG